MFNKIFLFLPLLALVSSMSYGMEYSWDSRERLQTLRDKIEKRLEDSSADLNAQLDYIHDAPVLEAASKRELNDLLEILLKRGADPNIVHPHLDYFPLHETCSEFGEPNLQGALLLIQHGANINMQTTEKYSSYTLTPLALAAKLGYPSMVELFLKHKADPNIADNSKGNTPLMYAVKANKKSEISRYIIKMLLYYGADPFKVNKLGYNAIDKAKKNFPELAILMEKAPENLRVMLMKLLSRGETPFNNKYITALIVNYCYSYMNPDGYKDSPELQKEFLNASKTGDLEVVKDCIRKRVDTNARDEEGNSALMLAAAYGYEDIVKYLLANDAILYGRNRGDLDAYSIARINGQTRIMQVLEEQGYRVY